MTHETFASTFISTCVIAGFLHDLERKKARAETGPQTLEKSYLVFASTVSGYRKADPRPRGNLE